LSLGKLIQKPFFFLYIGYQVGTPENDGAN